MVWNSHGWRSLVGRGSRAHSGNDEARLTRWSNTKNTSKLGYAKCDLLACDRAPSGANPFTMSKDTFRVLFVFLGLGVGILTGGVASWDEEAKRIRGMMKRG